MLKNIHYTTSLNFTHFINDRDELVDKACCTPHTHESEIRVVVPIKDYEFLDFKTVKKATEKILDDLSDKNITETHNLGETEKLVEYIAINIGMDLDRRVNVYIQETKKYGMEYVSDQ